METGSFVALASALVLATGSGAAAQHPSPPPPAPAALSVPNPLTGLTPGPRDLYRSPDGSDRFQHPTPLPHPAQPTAPFPGFYLPYPNYFPYAPVVDYQPLRPVAQRVEIPRGRLVLEALPDAAQVHVDGYYVGVAEDFGPRGRAMDLPAGAHRIELRAPLYELLTFSVIIKPNETIRFRGDMQALSGAQAPPPAPLRTARKSLYVIPNCYAGDKPPTGGLPRGCDRKKLQTRN